MTSETIFGLTSAAVKVELLDEQDGRPGAPRKARVINGDPDPSGRATVG
jgi:hypothetical protein